MGPGSSHDATRLALAAADGDPVAQSAFIRATQTEVWRLCAALTDVGSADDLTQETYLRAWKALPGFEGRSSARTWLLSIARRACADHIRGLLRRRRLSERVAVTARSNPWPDSTAATGLWDLVARLPLERRSAFVLTQVAGLTYAECAVVENVPVGTIRSRVARAREDLLASWQAAAAV